MTTFHPSDHSYGAAEGQTDSQADTAATLAEYAPAISSLLFGEGSREEAATIKARIENYRGLYDGASSSFMKNLYAMRINTLQGKLTALEEQAGEERVAVATTQAGKVGLALLLIGGTAAVGSLAWYFAQKAKTEKWKRQQPMR